MRANVRRSALNSCRGLIHGVALGGILTPASMSLAQAAERLHDFLRPLTGSGLTHTNRSPKFPVHFSGGSKFKVSWQVAKFIRKLSPSTNCEP
jgi:hypothetical protein